VPRHALLPNAKSTCTGSVQRKFPKNSRQTRRKQLRQRR
jgi:hypothetical protein